MAGRARLARDTPAAARRPPPAAKAFLALAIARAEAMPSVRLVA